MKHLNERHNWFNLDKNEDCVKKALRYTTKDGSMLTDDVVEKILKYPNNEVVIHRYGVIVFKKPLIRIGFRDFYGCSGLTSVTIPNSVESIENSAFSGCKDLLSVTIPNSVTSIGYGAFNGCSSLKTLTIPNSVTSIECNAFNGCSGLISIDVQIGNTKYDSRENCNAIIETYSNTLITGCTGLTSVTIPRGVSAIKEQVFSDSTTVKELIYAEGCTTALRTYLTSITSVKIPSSVTTIGDCAFDGCSSLTSITIPNTAPVRGENPK